MRSRWLLGFVLGACSPAASGSRAESVAIDPPSPETEESAPEPQVTRSCAIVPPRVETKSFDDVIVLGELQGKTWAIARSREAVENRARLLHLDARGELIETELPEFSALAALEPPHRIHFLDYAAVSRWWQVDVSDPDHPKPGPIANAPALGHDGSSAVKAFAVAGKVALISVYRVNYGGQETTYGGETALYDRTSGARLGTLHPFTTWSAECHARRCVGLATGADDSAELVTLDPRGARAERIGKWDCLRVASWREADRWTLALADRDSLGVVAIDLGSGARTRTASSALGTCGEIRPLALAGKRGIVIDERRFVAIDTGPRISTTLELPALEQRELALAPLPDGALLVDFTAQTGMIHTPTDSRGVRRYYHVWNFAGRAGLLRRTNGALQLDSVTPLPGDGSEGEFSRGPRPAVLVNGNHSAVIVSGDGDARVAHLSKPCE